MGLAQEEGVRKTLEEAVRNKIEQDAKQKCLEYYNKYSECSEKVLVLKGWRCSKQFKDYNDCIRQYCNDSAWEELKHKYSL
nr:Cytochrome C oxidase biogenesis protein Cmc1-like [Ipomoea batatas]